MLPQLVFEVEDWRGRLVHVTQRTFSSHAGKRPEFSEYRSEAETTIRDPDIVQESDTGATLIYRFGIGRPPFARLYLKVVVFYKKRRGRETGTVGTWFFTDSLEHEAPIVEHRAQWLNGQRLLLDSGGVSNGR